MGRANEVGREILIPLTSSLYVPGRLTDVENVVIDVGTGYYVKKVS
jgi:prefoldin alpha subunit